MAALVQTLVAASLGWLIASSLWIYPHSLSYFNESIGGPLNGPMYLMGSNIDWGQDLFYLRSGLNRLIAHGKFPCQMQVECEGLHYQEFILPNCIIKEALPNHFRLLTHNCSGVTESISRVVSVSHLRRLNGANMRVGYSIVIGYQLISSQK